MDLNRMLIDYLIAHGGKGYSPADSGLIEDILANFHRVGITGEVSEFS